MLVNEILRQTAVHEKQIVDAVNESQLAPVWQCHLQLIELATHKICRKRRVAALPHIPHIADIVVSPRPKRL